MKPSSRNRAAMAAKVPSLALMLLLAVCGRAVASDGDPCDDGLACTAGDRMAEGRCAGDPYSCDDGLGCTDDVCDGSGGCRHFVAQGYCLIDGNCHEGGASDPRNTCRVCEPTRGIHAWDTPTGRPCLGGVCRDGRCATMLRVQTTGVGSGVVLGSRLLCDGDCDVELATGTRIHLSAEPSRDSHFEGWSGACSGTGDCVLHMRTGARVIASFGRRAPSSPPVQLIVETEGEGIVTSFPAGLDCGSHCWHTFPHGTTVTLYATPRKGMQFRGWRGGCRGRLRECSIELRAAQMIAARFARSSVRRHGTAERGSERVVGPLDVLGKFDATKRVGEKRRNAADSFVGPPPPPKSH